VQELWSGSAWLIRFLLLGLAVGGTLGGLLDVASFSTIDRPSYPLVELTLLLILVGIVGTFAALLGRMPFSFGVLVLATGGFALLYAAVLMWAQQIWSVDAYYAEKTIRPFLLGEAPLWLIAPSCWGACAVLARKLWLPRPSLSGDASRKKS
jgi:hypothetical protein